MASFDRFDVYTQLMGGKHNLPQQLPTTSTPPASDPPPSDLNDEEENPSQIVDAFGNLQTYDDFVTSHPFPAPPAPAYENRHAGISHHSTRRSEPDAAVDFTLDARMGEPSEPGMCFCPFLAITKFPYKYVDGAFRQPIATAFFDEGKIWNRSWDLYYIWSDDAGKAIALITLAQAQALVDEVNRAFTDLQWRFDHKDGLTLTFDDPNAKYRPRFLGNTASSRDKYDFLLQSVLPPDSPEMDNIADDTSLTAYKEMVANAAEANRNKSKKQKQEKLENPVFHRQGMGNQLLQAQRFLGLVEEDGRFESTTPGPTNIDPKQPSAHPCEHDVIIIAIDVEAYEKSHGIITEVGVSTLDTRDLKGTAPGESGTNWQQFIRGRHFRVIEHKNYVNGEFVAGCPEKFDFGSSEWVSLKDMPSVLTSCFHEPFSKPPAQTSNDKEDPNQRRNLVLLGHDVGADIQYCHKLGFSVLGRGNLIATLDTKNMYQAYTREPSPRGLGTIMSDFDFPSWHLHNAGNDAVYTIWAMLATCVRDATTERGTEESRKKSAGGPLPQPPSASGHYTLGGAPLDL